jgi:hypothetical protein
MNSRFNYNHMKKRIIAFVFGFAIVLSLAACTKKPARQNQSMPPPTDTGLVNTAHLDHLYTPVSFSDGTQAACVYIYSQYPDYHLVDATGEGFTCVDDVSRATLVYARSSKFQTDTATQSKVFNLIRFILEMQSANGYFYNFLFAGALINTGGPTSINTPNWWSWRALQALTESGPLIKPKNSQLYNLMNAAVIKLVTQMKIDLVNLPQTTDTINGITTPNWLPGGSGTDQASTLILGLIPYCSATNDTIIAAYIKKLADGIVLMQQGDSTHFPYGSFLSFQNAWHAYGNAQAYALMQAGIFLNNPQYAIQAREEVDYFYPWLLQNGFISAFSISKTSGIYQLLTETSYDQIAYGFEPMVFAATEAYQETGQAKYADLAGHLAAWFLGANVADSNMYSLSTGICFDAISSASNVNLNSGAESTIEALLSMERVEDYPAVKAALNKYKKL